MIGQRGYLITGDAKFLAPYKTARDLINSRETKLANLLSDNPAQIANVPLLRGKIDKVLELLEFNLERFETKGLPAAQEVVRSGKSTEAMGDVRTLVATMEQIEQKLLDERTSDCPGRIRSRDRYAAGQHGTGLSLGRRGFRVVAARFANPR